MVVFLLLVVRKRHSAAIAVVSGNVPDHAFGGDSDSFGLPVGSRLTCEG